MNWLVIFGVSSAAINIISVIPYIRDIFLGKTKPERASWFIWTILGFIFFFTNLAEGAEESLFFVAMQVIVPMTILILAIKRGIGGFARRDKVGLAVAGLGLLLWYLTNNAVYALVFALSVDAAGAVLTAIKTWEQPFTETLISWAALIPVGILAMLAVGELDYVLLLFPFYFVILGTILPAIIIYRRPRVTDK